MPDHCAALGAGLAVFGHRQFCCSQHGDLVRTPPAAYASVCEKSTSRTTVTDLPTVLYRERITTPTGALIVVSDDADRLRAADWEDHETRMRQLLRRHNGAVEWRNTPQTSPASRALQAYFDGDLCAIDAMPTETNG